jgi:imidazolonepropionase-like amidohydrolase
MGCPRFLWVALALGPSACWAASGPDFALGPVNLVDGGTVRKGVTILVESGRIASIRPGAAVRLPAGTRVLKGQGRWVVPGSETFPTGANQHLEMLFPQEMGLSMLEALQAATESGAVSIGDTDAGRLREGARADFVVLRANPLDRVEHLRRIEWVVKGGRFYTQRELFEGLP